MQSSPKEPKGFFDGFDIWDWLAIYVCSDLGSTGIILLFTGGNGIWYLVIAWCLWWIHIYNVKTQIEQGTK